MAVYDDDATDRHMLAALGEDVTREEAIQLGYALFDEGMEFFQRKQYADAIRLFDQSLSINERYMAPSALGLCTNLNNLASAYDKIGQAQQAVFFYERAVGVLNHPSAVWDEQRRRAHEHVVSKLGRMARDDANVADDSAQFANAQRVAAVMWDEGLKLYAAERPSDALVLFKQVLSFNRKYRPSDAAVLATTLNNIGAAHERCGQPDDAVAYFRAAADALERSTVPNKEARLAHVRQRLAALHRKLASNGGAADVQPAARAHAPELALAHSTSPPRQESGARAAPPPPETRAAASAESDAELLSDEREVAE